MEDTKACETRVVNGKREDEKFWSNFNWAPRPGAQSIAIVTTMPLNQIAESEAQKQGKIRTRYLNREVS